MPRFVDVYSLRPVPPSTWPSDLIDWATTVAASGLVQFGGDPLTDAEALEFWMPVEFLKPDDGLGLLFRDDYDGIPGALIAWPDGCTHVGMPPRDLGDLLHFYRVARSRNEIYCDLTPYNQEETTPCVIQ